ncbi:MAG: DNA-methyltransferase [Alkalispirochaeta sp.]
MVTTHRVMFESAVSLPTVPDNSVDLVVTSPPYPMIAMWDGVFAQQEPGIQTSLAASDGVGAFSAMHAVLDEVWRESARVLRPGGFVCVNIGDATRTIGGDFRLFANHARIIGAMERFGMHTLPAILWRKQTNAPTKFMGSGMLPSGAYVTLEHEYILVFRNGSKRRFAPHDRDRRRKSALFWEERNQWFSDLWDLKGVRQRLHTDSSRGRSGAFPFELAFRLINMYSLHGDTVLDPFVGTGTTIAAALSAARNSIGVEIDRGFSSTIEATLSAAVPTVNERQQQRYTHHIDFVDRYQAEHESGLGHLNRPHNVPVMTKQETDLELLAVDHIERSAPGTYRVAHRRLDTTDGEHQSSGSPTAPAV